MSEELIEIVSGLSYGCFDMAFVFGSALLRDSPGDVDVLLVYSGDQTLEEVVAEKKRVVEGLVPLFAGLTVDVTTLSWRELEDVGFLDSVTHKRIWSRRSEVG